jgi:uncharacterized protein YjaZ|tara:strand:+ start:22792 stop:23619 length:828 start_codon:yes stop_codon:yes gene_type:complete
MKKHSIERNSKIIELFMFLDEIIKKNKELLVNDLLKEIIEIKDVNYIGHEDEIDLKETLKWLMFDHEDNQEFNFKIKEEDEEYIKKTIDEETNNCDEFIRKKLSFFIFPVFSKFIIEKLNGIMGASTLNDTILIFVNPVGEWKKSLREVIYHELAHAVSPYYDMGNLSIGEGIIFDGIAEHFREDRINGDRAPWSKALSEDEAMDLFEKIKPLLDKRDEKIYGEVFFGAGDYPLWTGYSIGYYLIGKYLKKQDKIDWKKIINTNPSEIMNEIDSY